MNREDLLVHTFFLCQRMEDSYVLRITERPHELYHVQSIEFVSFVHSMLNEVCPVYEILEHCNATRTFQSSNNTFEMATVETDWRNGAEFSPVEAVDGLVDDESVGPVKLVLGSRNNS